MKPAHCELWNKYKGKLTVRSPSGIIVDVNAARVNVILQWLGMELNKNLEWEEIYARVREAYEHASPSLPDIPPPHDSSVEQQAFLVADPRYTIPLYYGASGWINLDVQNGVNWSEVDGMLESSYRQIALKRMLKALDG